MERRLAAATLLTGLIGATAAVAQDAGPPDAATEPLWELGVGGFAAVGPQYPASSEYDVNGLPVPYFIYRGDFFRVDEGSARIVPLDTDTVEIDLSVNAAFGADSDDNDAREGMPDLDTLVEIGPELILKGAALGIPDSIGLVEFALQGRAVFSVDFDDDGLEYRGVVVEPQARISKPGFFGEGSFAAASIGPIFATEELHDYFYQVDAPFVRATRPAFDATGGYLGTEANLVAGFELTDRLNLFVGSEIGVYAGAANRDSPLFEDELNLSGFIGFSYSLFESDRRVPRGR